jgi:prepilin-type processing-associated H-X9-DG protein
MNGVYYAYSVTKIADITDGTSNTIMFGEHTRAIESAATGDNISWHWWTSGNYGDTICNTYWPINPQKKLPYTCNDFTTGSNTIGAVSSMHPGGANVAFCDGSVRFIKDTINTWANVTTATYCQPNGLTVATVTDPVIGSVMIWQLAAGTNIGVWQKLATRNGGESISSDSF